LIVLSTFSFTIHLVPGSYVLLFALFGSPHYHLLHLGLESVDFVCFNARICRIYLLALAQSATLHWQFFFSTSRRLSSNSLNVLRNAFGSSIYGGRCRFTTIGGETAQHHALKSHLSTLISLRHQTVSTLCSHQHISLFGYIFSHIARERVGTFGFLILI